jgi:hypothetical protein
MDVFNKPLKTKEHFIATLLLEYLETRGLKHLSTIPDNRNAFIRNLLLANAFLENEGMIFDILYTVF